MDEEFINSITNLSPDGSSDKIRSHLIIIKKLKQFMWLLPFIYLLYVIVLFLMIILVLTLTSGIGGGYFAMGLLALLVADFLPGPFILGLIINIVPPNLLFPFQGGYFLFFLAIALNFVTFSLIGFLIDRRKTIIEWMKKISLIGYAVILVVILMLGGLVFYSSHKSNFVEWTIKENPINQLSESKLFMDHQIMSKKLSEIPLKYIGLDRPDGIKYPTLYFSNDGTQFAYKTTLFSFGGVVENGLVINNETLPGLTVVSFSFSPDSRHYAYTAYGQEVNSGQFIIIDDKRQNYNLPDSGSNDIIFSPDSKHYAYQIEMPGYTSAILIDDQIGPKYSYISSNFAFSPDSKHYLYVGNNVDDQTGTKNSHLIIDGKIIQDIDPGSLEYLTFTPDSQKIAYISRQANGLSVFINEQQDKNNYDQLGSLQFFSDGKHYAYVGTRDKKKFIILDGQEYEYENVGFDMTLSPDGTKIAFKGAKRIINEETFIPLKEFIIFNEQKGQEYDAVSNLVFSPDSKHFIYSAKDGKKNTIIFDNQNTETCYSLIDNIHFSEDGSKLIYNAMVGQEIWLIVDDINDGISFCEKKDFKPLISQKLEECNKVVDLTAKQSCYLDYAKETGNYSICEDQVFDQVNKVICYSNVAIGADSIVICSYAKNQDTMDKCYAAVPPGINHNINRCNQVQNQESKEICLLNVAITNKDKTICDSLLTQRDPCYSNVAIAKKDLSLCNLIKEDFFKQYCLNSINQANKQ